MDVQYWAKVGVEEILHYFGIPEQHDENCFFHAKEFGKATVEDCWKDYCPKCREFMQQLKYPLDFEKLFMKVEEIYEIKPKHRRRRGWKESLIHRLRRFSQIMIFKQHSKKSFQGLQMRLCILPISAQGSFG